MNSSVFNWRLKDASEGNDVRDLDRLFHIRAAATGKARSPAVERRVGGTTSVDVDEECRRWPAARSDTCSRSRDKYDGARPFRQRKTSTESLTRSAAQFSANAAPEEVVWRGRTCSAIKQVVQRRWVQTAVCSAGRLGDRRVSHCHSQVAAEPANNMHTARSKIMQNRILFSSFCSCQ